MPSAFSWPVLVPSAPSVLRRRLPWALGSNYVLLGKPGSPCNRCSACCRKWRPRGTERRLDSKQGRDSSFPLHAVRPPSLDLGRNFQPLWCNQRFNSWRLPGAASFTFLGLALGLSIDRAPCGKWMVSLSARSSCLHGNGSPDRSFSCHAQHPTANIVCSSNCTSHLLLKASLTSLTGRCRGRLHQCALRPCQARAPELGR